MALMKTRRVRLIAAAAGLAVAGSFVFAGAAPARTASAFAPPVKLNGGCGGEPSIDVDGSGHVYVSSPKGIGAAVASCDGVATGARGVATWVSADGAKTFGPKISVGSTDAGGDSDTQVDPKTSDVYVADLAGTSSVVCVSHDHGQTYVSAQLPSEDCSRSTLTINVTGHTGFDDDREWLNVYGPTPSYPHRDVFLSYHDFTLGVPFVWRSQDGGPFEPLSVPAFSDPAFDSQVVNGTVMAKPVIDHDGTMYGLVTTQSAGQGPLTHLWLIKSIDHGATWSATSIFDGGTGAQLGLVFNDIAIDGAGNLYALSLGNKSQAVPPVHAYLFSSTNHGATWSAPLDINPDGKALALAAMHGGPQAGQLVIGFYHSTNTTDPNDVTGKWIYQALETTNATASSPRFTTATLGATENSTGLVHQGQICTQGIACTTGQITGGGQGNRNLADFTSVSVDKHGCAIFTYADDGTILSDQSNYASALVNNDVTRQTTDCFKTAKPR
jgi:hypothetical protein